MINFVDRFNPWAVLDVAMGRFGHVCGPFCILPWAVLDISKIYGPFSSGLFWFMGHFGIDPQAQTSRTKVDHLEVIDNQLFSQLEHRWFIDSVNKFCYPCHTI